MLAGGDQFGVHHDPRDTSIAIVKWVYFRDNEHLEDSPCERRGESP